MFCLIRRVRITASGGEVGRLNTGGGAEVNDDYSVKLHDQRLRSRSMERPIYFS